VAVVFVHGVPETPAIWEPLLAELGRGDTVTLAPPGFGAPVPDGFGATADEYLAWLTAQVAAIGEPVHLVGHDWGGGHVARLAGARPDLVLSWCTDVAGLFDPAYVWHDLAQTWQTPGAGEEAVGAMTSLPDADLAAAYEGLGMTPAAALACARAAGPEMARCILALYRSAAQPALIGWGRLLEQEPARQRPALAINATNDEYVGGGDLAHRGAQRLGMREVVLDGLGHWWMMQDPARGARVIGEFLASVGA
jgi:pimeloyl-ACP methyl ester carboxylesterase